MTHITTTDAGMVSIAAGRLARLAGLATTAFEDHLRRRATLRALKNLNDHQLDDIGLTRADVDALH